MSLSLIEELPKIVAEGKKEVERILDWTGKDFFSTQVDITDKCVCVALQRQIRSFQGALF